MSDKKLGRTYILRIQKPPNGPIKSNEYIQISWPFTCEFNIERHNLASTNTAQFTVYNLKEETRQLLVKDPIVFDINDQRAVEFYAGYANPGELIPRCFRGTVKRAYSVRQGSEFKTIIEAYDGVPSSTTKTISLSFPKGAYKPLAFEQIAQEITKSTNGKVTSGQKVAGIFKRAQAFFGQPLEILQQLSEQKVFMDSGNVYALDDSEVVTGDISEISYENGLIGTPKRMESVVELDMIFEPRLKPSQIIQLKSLTAKYFKGFYKITGFRHRGVISGTQGGDAITSVTMQLFKDPVYVLDRATNEYRQLQ